MFNVEQIRTEISTSLKDAMRILDRTGFKIVIVTNEERRVLGTLTDGDIRRALLRGADLSSPVSEAMNTSPVLAGETQTHSDIVSQMRRENVLQVPVVDAAGVLQSLVSLSEPPETTGLDTIPIVLMAGGLGKRLRPLTNDCPKPMLPIAGRPLLDRIIERFKKLGFRTFFISVNYLGHQIEEYFGSGARHGVSISYLREDKKLGTGGSLSLLPKNMNSPIIVMNGDLITEFDFRRLIESHEATGAIATMCTREHRTSIPFGVVEHDGNVYKEVVEKPTIVHQINAGVYCISKAALDFVPTEQFYDMPSLFTDLIKAEQHCSVHKISDEWYDIGSLAEYERAQSLFASSSDTD